MLYCGCAISPLSHDRAPRLRVKQNLPPIIACVQNVSIIASCAGPYLAPGATFGGTRAVYGSIQRYKHLHFYHHLPISLSRGDRFFDLSKMAGRLTPETRIDFYRRITEQLNMRTSSGQDPCAIIFTLMMKNTYICTC